MSAKRRRMSNKSSAVDKRTTVYYERLTSDTCDMGKYLHGLGGMRYFQLIHDEGSRYKWCFPLKNRSDANKNTIKLITELLAAGHRIKRFTSDGGGEFVNTELKPFLESRRIRFVPTHPYTPEENTLVKKMNGALVIKLRTAMHVADLPNRLWPEVLQYNVDNDNVGFVYVAKRNDKLSPKAEPALLLGFARSTKGYRLLHLRTGTIVEARDVNFREDITISLKYISVLFMGNGGDKIPFVPLPVEYVAEERVRSEAVSLATGSLPQGHVTKNNADADGAPGLGGELLSSGSESDFDSAEVTDPVSLVAGGTLGATPAGSVVGAVAQPRITDGGRRQTRGQREQNADPPRWSTIIRRQSGRLDGYPLMLEMLFLDTPETVEEALR
ncbi:Transposon Polyprotein integrase [Phytophthora palmivora]|uniref:Transposon Polyprotein integrase n=1 Tax=Phytophthora palmivora TaxID=4796 RepID=A0A2P4X0J2_9STRA|nr:Transposon Polyprotein integrase [Phytophthora palmivora]